MSADEFLLEEGWYLMSTADLERELARRRDPGAGLPRSNARRLAVDDAIAFRNAGNVPDERGRTLRLVLEVRDAAELASLDSKRLAYEPDYHEAPGWRREGSRPVNVVPLRQPDVGPVRESAWWEDPQLSPLEEEFGRTGRVEGIVVPAAYRGFVYKTVLSLQAANRPVTVEAIVDSVARWVPAHEAERIRHALRAANPGGP